MAVACPFCMTMLNDAGGKLESTVPVYDIAEVVASRIAPGAPFLGGAVAAALSVGIGMMLRAERRAPELEAAGP